MRREGQASDQNKIISMLFFPPSLSSSEQSRNVDLDVREGPNCETVCKLRYSRWKGKFTCLFGSLGISEASVWPSRDLSAEKIVWEVQGIFPNEAESGVSWVFVWFFFLNFHVLRMPDTDILNETWFFRSEDTVLPEKQVCFNSVSVKIHIWSAHSKRVHSVWNYCLFAPLIPSNGPGLENLGEEEGSEFKWWMLASWVIDESRAIIYHF